jgi:hypothetical protein
VRNAADWRKTADAPPTTADTFDDERTDGIAVEECVDDERGLDHLEMSADKKLKSAVRGLKREREGILNAKDLCGPKFKICEDVFFVFSFNFIGPRPIFFWSQELFC